MSGFDRQYYFSLLYQDPVAADDYLTAHQTGGMTKAQFADEYATTVRPAAHQTIQNVVHLAFAQEHPELINGVSPQQDLENGKKIAKYIAENNLPDHDVNSYAESLKIAYQATKHELTLGASGETVRAPNGQFVSEKHFVSTAPLEQVEQYYKQKYPDKRR